MGNRSYGLFLENSKVNTIPYLNHFGKSNNPDYMERFKMERAISEINVVNSDKSYRRALCFKPKSGFFRITAECERFDVDWATVTPQPTLTVICIKCYSPQKLFFHRHRSDLLPSHQMFSTARSKKMKFVFQKVVSGC